MDMRMPNVLSHQPVLSHVKTAKETTTSLFLRVEEKGLLKFPDSCLHFGNPLLVETAAQDLCLGHLGRAEELQE